MTSYAQNVTIASGAALSGTISFREFAYGIIHMPAGWDAANIGFQVSSDAAGTFQPLYDSAGSLVQIASPAANRALAVPTTVMAARYVKIWSQTGGANTNQTAARALIIDMKS